MQTEETKKIKRPKQKYYWDFYLILTVFLLICFGLVMIYSSSYYNAIRENKSEFSYVLKQGLSALIGIVAIAGILGIGYKRILNRFSFPLQIIGLICMLAVQFTSLGIEANGRKRWLGVGEASFQPTELVKIATILFVVKYICDHRNKPKSVKDHLVFVLFLLAPLAFVTANNLSSGIIIALIIIVLFYVSTNKPKWFWLAAGGMVALYVIGYFFSGVIVDLGILKEYQISRVVVWRNPEAYATGDGYQVLQGLYAIGSGGLFGKGLGNSTQKLGFIPEAQNDMIFSIICEELGIFGAICIIALYVFLFYRMLVIIRNARDYAGKLIVIGVLAHFAIQLILNIAVVTNSMPNTGVSLPFISYGGTSEIFLLSEIGLVLSVGRDIPIKRKRVEKEQEEKEKN